MRKYVVMNARDHRPVAIRMTEDAAFAVVSHFLSMWGAIDMWTVCIVNDDESLPQDAPESSVPDR
jgi:hypothetical protein